MCFRYPKGFSDTETFGYGYLKGFSDTDIQKFFFEYLVTLLLNYVIFESLLLITTCIVSLVFKNYTNKYFHIIIKQTHLLNTILVFFKPWFDLS